MEVEDSTIIKVIKHDDGTVQEVSAGCDGSVKETFYRPHYHSDISQHMLSNTFVPTEDKGRMMNPTKQMFFYIAFTCTYISMLIAWTIPLNPYFLPKPSRLTLPPISYPIHCNRGPIQDYIKECYNTYFCIKDIDMPMIKTPAGSFFPNFTKDSGQDGNYHEALKWALTLMNNDNCKNITIHYNNNITTSQRNETDWKFAEEILLEALFILQSKCHPEAYILTRGRCSAYRMGPISIPSVTKLLYTSECNLNWTALYSDSYIAVKGPPCSKNVTEEFLTFPELFLFIDKVEIGTQ
ncbi:unknown [Suid gammaherpesvirus 3]|uniref:Uncharacterized protein n=1 Tax=Suid gammaherpesvirus 3 TaxID=1960249 RepID=Q8JJQ9_9GAMA|nr:unknown [Porcine lymphotropic herpesvirus 1]AAM22127.1 unknown [Porcine lymphotropic herpesvirus 1]